MTPSPNLTRLRVIYEWVASHYLVHGFDEWVGRVILFWPAPYGGIAFVQDFHDPSLVWIQAVSHDAGIYRYSILKLCAICGQLGAKVVALEAHNPRVGRLFGKMGFQHIRDNIYSVRVDNVATSGNPDRDKCANNPLAHCGG